VGEEPWPGEYQLRLTGQQRTPRQGKQAAVGRCSAPEGATVAQITDGAGWAPHAVGGFFAGLKTKGIAVAVLERVRQVGPNKDGAKGSSTVYRVAA
jgi:hypothetical protein